MGGPLLSVRRPAGGHLGDLLALGPHGATSPISGLGISPSPTFGPNPSQVLPLNHVQSVLLFKRNFYRVIERRTRKADLLEKLIY